MLDIAFLDLPPNGTTVFQSVVNHDLAPPPAVEPLGLGAARRPAGAGARGARGPPGHPHQQLVCYSINLRFLLLLAGDVEVHPGPTTFTPLPDLNHEQIDQILKRFQLVCRNPNRETRIEVVKCIDLFDKKFSGYLDKDVLVGFNRSGNFQDMKSRDDKVRLVKDTSPCKICHRNVDENELGIRCSGCELFFHNKCATTPMKLAAFKIIADTPDWVKVYCPSCLITTAKTVNSIEEIKENLVVMSNKISAQVQNNANEPHPYRAAAMSSLGSNMIKVNKSVQRLERNDTELQKHKEEKSDRTCIVLKYQNKEIVSSGDIRKIINKEFPGIIIRNARTTVGGSILLEFDNKIAADEVQTKWKNTLFGGNEGLKRVNEPNHAIIVKHVYVVDKSDEQLVKEITDNYPNVKKCELFKKDERFTGTIKLVFNGTETIQNLLVNRISIFRQMYIVDVFNPKPRVIKCNYCQKIGHVSRLCRSENPKCGKCTSEEHETKNCQTPPASYKCCHCHGNHITGNPQCPVNRNKLDEILSRRDDA